MEFTSIIRLIQTLFYFRRVFFMKTIKICLNSIDKVKAFVNDITKFDTDFDLVSGR